MHGVKFSNLKKIFIVVTIIILLLTIKLLDSVEKTKAGKWVEQTNSNQTQKSFSNEKHFLKVFHLDLKGGPPKVTYLLKILPMIREAGANAILIEYEDMFPFSGILKNVSAKNAYSLNEVKILVKFAESIQMNVIPLVQTFGHLEYLLKLEEFEGLREMETFPQEICPQNSKAVKVVKEMIKQIMAVHLNSRYVHIGCDEVRHIGTCTRCSRIDSTKLFSNHVVRIADYITLNYPKVTPLIWDDMLRQWTYLDFENSGLGSLVEPVVWIYGKSILNFVPPLMWNIYERVFPKIWIASSFKGAVGETETLPNLTFHLENNVAWKKIITREERDLSAKLKIGGIFITGWSRYDHFAVLCELLPVGIPSLILSLTFLDTEMKEDRIVRFNKWLKILGCPREYFLSWEYNESAFENKMGNCSFPGNDVYSGIVEYRNLRGRVMKIAKEVEFGGWTNVYNFKKNFTSYWRLTEMFPQEGFAGENLRNGIGKWKSSFLTVMKNYFDQHTVIEWEEQNIKPLEEKMETIKSNFHMFKERKIWPRRPLG